MESYFTGYVHVLKLNKETICDHRKSRTGYPVYLMRFITVITSEFTLDEHASGDRETLILIFEVKCVRKQRVREPLHLAFLLLIPWNHN